MLPSESSLDIKMEKYRDKQRQSCVQRAMLHIRRNRCSSTSLGLLTFVAVGLLLVWSGGVSKLTDSPIAQPGKVLLVTAHPDDEVIFFSSTVTALHASGAEVFLLCLTNGRSDLSLIGLFRSKLQRPAAAGALWGWTMLPIALLCSRWALIGV